MIEHLMERLDKLIAVLQEGNAINMAHFEFQVKEAQQAQAPAPTTTILSADDQIKAAIAKQKAKLNRDG